MNPDVKTSLVWGVIGLLTFLVLIQAYEIVQDVRVAIAVKGGAAIVVGIAATVSTYLATPRMADAAGSSAGDTPPGDGDRRHLGNEGDAADDVDDIDESDTPVDETDTPGEERA